MRICLYWTITEHLYAHFCEQLTWLIHGYVFKHEPVYPYDLGVLILIISIQFEKHIGPFRSSAVTSTLYLPGSMIRTFYKHANMLQICLASECIKGISTFKIVLKIVCMYILCSHCLCIWLNLLCFLWNPIVY